MKPQSLGLTTPSPTGSSPGAPTRTRCRAGLCSPSPLHDRESRHERHQIKPLAQAPVNIERPRRFGQHTARREDRDNMIGPLLDQFIVFMSTAKRVGSFPGEGPFATVV